MADVVPRARLSNFPARSRATVHGWPALLFGLPFAGLGGWVVLMAVGTIAIPPGSLHAPRWVLGVAGGTFGVAGLFLILHGLAGIVVKRRAATIRQLRPGEPWLADHRWDPTRSRSAGFGRLAHQVVGLAFMAVFLAPFHWWAIAAGGGWFVGILVGLFDLILIGALVHIVVQTARHCRHGRVTFRFDDFPFRAGEAVTGRLRLTQVSALDRLEVTLRCIEEAYEKRGSGDDQRDVVVCYEVHREALILDGPFDVSCLDGVPLVFDLPPDAPGTALLARPPRYWDLEVRGIAPGPDVVAHLLVPVYESADQVPSKRAAA